MSRPLGLTYTWAVPLKIMPPLTVSQWISDDHFVSYNLPVSSLRAAAAESTGISATRDTKLLSLLRPAHGTVTTARTAGSPFGPEYSLGPVKIVRGTE